jgi:hypothetical protein
LPRPRNSVHQLSTRLSGRAGSKCRGASRVDGRVTCQSSIQEPGHVTRLSSRIGDSTRHNSDFELCQVLLARLASARLAATLPVVRLGLAHIFTFMYHQLIVEVEPAKLGTARNQSCAESSRRSGLRVVSRGPALVCWKLVTLLQATYRLLSAQTTVKNTQKHIWTCKIRYRVNVD